MIGVAVLAAAGASYVPAEAAPKLESMPVTSVFHIEKSENRNQVHYAVRVDARCRPVGTLPVYGYWRDLEDGPKAISPLLAHQQAAYGLEPPLSIKRTDDSGEIRIRMRGFPDRTLLIMTFREGAACRARAFATIKAKPALLTSIYVEISPLFSVDYVILRGVGAADGKPVEEKVDD